MKLGPRGAALIEAFEGLFLTAYLCPANVWTIGIGHTKGVKPGDTCTREQALEWFAEDVRWCEEAIERRVKVPINQEQFDALVSFIFNLGEPNFAGSTLLKHLNAGHYDSAAEQFLKWNRAGGRVLPGLTRRREAERALFLSQA